MQSRFVGFFGGPRSSSRKPTKRNNLTRVFEQLEGRQMMAGLVYRRPPVATAPPVDPPVVVAPPSTPTNNTPSTPTIALPPVTTADGVKFTPSSLNQFTISASTGEKPQSKVWQQDGIWFTVMPDKSGTWVRRLDGTTWNPILKLSTSTSAQADVKQVGNVTHVLLYGGNTSQLASIEFVSGGTGGGSYKAWSARPTTVNVALPSGTETATIEMDSTGRMWLCTDPGSRIQVMYSDGNYSTWSAPITLATGIDSGDLASIIAIPGGKIGVFWSDHSTKRFGFRTHEDGTDPNLWAANEVPGGSSAVSVGDGMADDHLHLAAASDGTVYVIAKTSYDSGSQPMLVLMVRRPNGKWDPVYNVDTKGTRPTIAISETHNRLVLIYTYAVNSNSGGGEIVYRESPLDVIHLSARKSLMASKLNDATVVKSKFDNSLVVIASSGSTARSVILRTTSAPTNPNPPTTQPNSLPEPQPEPQPQPQSEPEPRPEPQPEPEPELPPSGLPAVMEFQDGVSQNGSYNGTRDASLFGDSSSSKKTNYGTRKEVETNGNPDRSAIVSWDVSSIVPGSVVAGAEITLNITSGSTETFSLYAVNKSWDETQVTWAQSVKGTNWGSAGAQGAADRGNVSIGTLTATAKGLAKITLNAAGIALVQSWVDNPSSNHGIAIQNYSGKSDSLAFASREARNAAERPKLSVAYSGSSAANQALVLAIAAGIDATKTRV